MIDRTYSELITLPSFEERYEYLRLGGEVGKETFGFERYLNQMFYKSKEWKAFRRDIIIRDLGCDLGILDREIKGPVTIHHLRPITSEDIIQRSRWLMDPENVICTSDITHKALHYGDKSLLITTPIERSEFDTCPWKRL